MNNHDITLRRLSVYFTTNREGVRTLLPLSIRPACVRNISRPPLLRLRNVFLWALDKGGYARSLSRQKRVLRKEKHSRGVPMSADKYQKHFWYVQALFLVSSLVESQKTRLIGKRSLPRQYYEQQCRFLTEGCMMNPSTPHHRDLPSWVIPDVLSTIYPNRMSSISTLVSVGSTTIGWPILSETHRQKRVIHSEDDMPSASCCIYYKIR